MNATAKNGDVWTGDVEYGEGTTKWWIYRDNQGQLYSSREVPAYRIVLDNATQIKVNGKLTIVPINALPHDPH